MVFTGWPVAIAVELATARWILDFVGCLRFISIDYGMHVLSM